MYLADHIMKEPGYQIVSKIDSKQLHKGCLTIEEGCRPKDVRVRMTMCLNGTKSGFPQRPGFGPDLSIHFMSGPWVNNLASLGHCFSHSYQRISNEENSLLLWQVLWTESP